MLDIKIITSTLGQPRLMMDENITYLELLHLLQTRYQIDDLLIRFNGEEICQTDQFKSVFELGLFSGCSLSVDIRDSRQQQEYDLNIKKQEEEQIVQQEQLQQIIMTQKLIIQEFDQELSWYKNQRKEECDLIERLRQDIKYFLAQLRLKTEQLQTMNNENREYIRESYYFQSVIEDQQLRLLKSEEINQQLQLKIDELQSLRSEQLQYYKAQQEQIKNQNTIIENFIQNIQRMEIEIGNSNIRLQEVESLNKNLAEQIVFLKQPFTRRIWNKLRDRHLNI